MRYRHRALRPGVPFTVPTDIEADLLKRARCARDAVPNNSERGYEVAAVTAEDSPARPKLKRKPQRYQRRDLRADD